MCMKGTDEGCVLLTRMAKVEVRQNVLIILVLLIGMFLGYITIKMLNSQIYLLTGERGLNSISTISRGEYEMLRESVNQTNTKQGDQQ